MGATYVSLQVPDTPGGDVNSALETFNSEDERGLAAYVAPAVGRWTAVYPDFSPETDRFAKYLSRATGQIVLTLASMDEDNFLCNVCKDGKDLSFFKVMVGDVRKGKKRDTFTKRLDMLADFADAQRRSELADYLCDLTDVTFSSDALKAFADVFGIANTQCSFTYIEKGDHAGDFDAAVDLERIRRR